jgi:hypothetical protein
MAGATSGWKAYKEVIKQETLAIELFDLHEKYGETNRESNQRWSSLLIKIPSGEIVRIGPNEVGCHSVFIFLFLSICDIPVSLT